MYINNISVDRKIPFGDSKISSAKSDEEPIRIVSLFIVIILQKKKMGSSFLIHKIRN